MTETPCEVWFYHLERTSLDQALPELLEKTLARGWRALVRTPSRDRVELPASYTLRVSTIYPLSPQ